MNFLAKIKKYFSVKNNKIRAGKKKKVPMLIIRKENDDMKYDEFQLIEKIIDEMELESNVSKEKIQTLRTLIHGLKKQKIITHKQRRIKK